RGLLGTCRHERRKEQDSDEQSRDHNVIAHGIRKNWDDGAALTISAAGTLSTRVKMRTAPEDAGKQHKQRRNGSLPREVCSRSCEYQYRSRASSANCVERVLPGRHVPPRNAHPASPTPLVSITRSLALRKSAITRRTASTGTANTIPINPNSSPPAITARNTRIGCTRTA